VDEFLDDKTVKIYTWNKNCDGRLSLPGRSYYRIARSPSETAGWWKSRSKMRVLAKRTERNRPVCGYKCCWLCWVHTHSRKVL